MLAQNAMVVKTRSLVGMSVLRILSHGRSTSLMTMESAGVEPP